MRDSDSFFEEARRQLEGLAYEQDAMLGCLSGGRVRFSEFNVPLAGARDIVVLPKFTSPDRDLVKLKDLPRFDGSVFAEWHKLDLPMMLLSGLLGGVAANVFEEFLAYLSKTFGQWTGKLANPASDKIHEFFAGLQERWGNSVTSPGSVDARQLGHVDHWRSVNDLPNPSEVDWKFYHCLSQKTGQNLPRWMEAGCNWLQKLQQGTFPKGELAPSGQPLSHWLFDPSRPENGDIVHMLRTSGLSNAVGIGITNTLMGTYLGVTEKSVARVFKTANYRTFSLMAGANLMAALTSILLPPHKLLLGVLPVLGYYMVRLLLLERRIHMELDARERILAENESTLLGNLALVAGNDAALKGMLRELDEIDQQVQRYYHGVNDRQDALAKEILGGVL